MYADTTQYWQLVFSDTVIDNSVLPAAAAIAKLSSLKVLGTILSRKLSCVMEISGEWRERWVAEFKTAEALLTGVWARPSSFLFSTNLAADNI